MRTIRMAQFGLGPIGLESLRLAAGQPWVEIVGAIDNDPAKAGRPIAQISGAAIRPDLRVLPSLDELLRNTRPEVILHTASSSAEASLRQMRPALQAGIAVATTCEELIFPALRTPELAAEFDRLCRESGARLVATGVNPGFVMDVLPVCLTGVCRKVEHVQVDRVVNASTRRGPLQAKIGSGQPADAFREKLRSGRAGHAGLRESLALLAHALGWRMDRIDEQGDVVVADTPIKTAHFSVQPGQARGIHQRAVGLSGGVEKIVLDLKMYLDAPNPHDSVSIRGEPGLRVVVEGGVAGDTATVAALINVVPRLLAASAGLKLMTDLSVPVIACRHGT